MVSSMVVLLMVVFAPPLEALELAPSSDTSLPLATAWLDRFRRATKEFVCEDKPSQKFAELCGMESQQDGR